VQGLTSTLSLSPDAIQTINEMLRMHCERMLALLTEAQSDIQRLVNQFLFELDRFINGPHKCHPSTVRLLSGRQLRLYQLHFIGQQLRRLIEKWESHLVI
jgi:hypothetical protein